MNTSFLKNEAVQIASPKTATQQAVSYLRTGLFLFASFLFCSDSFAQDQFLWTGNTDTSWTDRSNWDYYPYGSSTKISPAPFYPGQGGGINPNGTRDDIAIFTDISNVDCYIDRNSTGLTNALRVGGIIVNGYAGTLSQIDGNRFNVSDGADAGGGTGFWDGSTQISSGHIDLNDETGTLAYRAHFDFAPPSNGFQGGATIVGGIVPSYSLLFAVPLMVTDGSTFKAPKDQTKIRHNATFANGTDFDNSHQGTVVLSNLSGGFGIRYYQFGGVHFWDLKVTPNGAAPITKEFSGGICVVENNFMTTGLGGVLDGGSNPIIMNGAIGTEIHIKNDLIVGNNLATPSASYTPADDFGNLFLVMNGNNPTDPDQKISHPYNNDNFSGILPSLRIDKPIGSIYLEGPTTFNNTIQFVQGIVKPTTLSNQNNLTDDVLVLNSNTTILGASNSSHCEGAIRVRTGKAIELPIGKSNLYRPAVVGPISGVSTGHSIINMYDAEYFDATAVESILSFETPTLTEISSCEVWAIQKYNNTAADPWTFNLELNYNPNPCFIEDQCELAVTRWDVSSAEWVSHGNSGVLTTTIAGDPTIQTALSLISTNFERSTSIIPDLFTIGKLSEGVCSPCDVDVCVDYCFEEGMFKFDPNITYGAGSSPAGIEWNFGDGTSTDLNPIHTFTTSGLKSVSVTVYAVYESDTCSNTYNFQVFNNGTCSPSMGLKRHIQHSKDAKKVKTIVDDNTDLIVTPNPSTTGLVLLNLDTKSKGSFDYIITNTLGQTILTGKVSGNEQTTVNTSKLAAGSYLINVQLLDKKITKRFSVVK